MKRVSRRELLKFVGVMSAGAFLTSCYDSETTFRKPPKEVMPIGQLKRPPYYMVDGEPQAIPAEVLKAVQDRLAEVEVPQYGGNYPVLDAAVVNQLGDWTIVTVPRTNGGSIAITSGPANIVLEANLAVDDSGLTYPSYVREHAVIDTTKSLEDYAINRTVEMNLNRFKNERGIDVVPQEVEDMFRYGKRISIESMTGEELSIPGNVSFINTLVYYLNHIQTVIVKRHVNRDGMNINLTQAGLEVEETRTRFLDLFFSLSPEEMMVPESRTEDFKRVNDELVGILAEDNTPEKLLEVEHVMDNLFTTMALFKKKVDFIKYPEAAMAIMRSFDMLGQLLHDPNDTPLVYKEKIKKINAINWLSKNDGKGIWNRNDNDPAVIETKKDFWLELPSAKPRALNVTRLKVDLVKDAQGNVTDTITTYKNEIILLYPRGFQIIYNEEKRNEQPESPLSTELIEDLTLNPKQISEEELRDQGYTISPRDRDKPEWQVLSIEEINPRFVRLHHVPEDKDGANPGLHWTLPLKDNDVPKEALISSVDPLHDLWGDLKRLISFGEKYVHQSLLLDSGKGKGDRYENRFFTWAEDVTDLWKKLLAQGVSQVSRIGLTSPQGLLAKVATGYYMPRDQSLRDLMSSWIIESVVEGHDLPPAWGSVTSETGVPVFDLQTGNPVAEFKTSDFFYYYQLGWDDRWTFPDGNKMPLLIVSPDKRYIIPLDTSSLQLVESGIAKTERKFLYNYLPWLATAILGGPKLLKLGGKIIGIIGGIFTGG